MTSNDDVTNSNESVGHETRDVKFRPILFFGIVLIVSAVVLHALVALMLIGFADRVAESQPPLSPLSKQRPIFPQGLNDIPPPRLQQSEFHDVRELIERDEQILNSYGWIDRKDGIVRIPIERAMEILSNPKISGQHGIPIWEAKQK